MILCCLSTPLMFLWVFSPNILETSALSDKCIDWIQRQYKISSASSIIHFLRTKPCTVTVQLLTLPNQKYSGDLLQKIVIDICNLKDLEDDRKACLQEILALSEYYSTMTSHRLKRSILQGIYPDTNYCGKNTYSIYERELGKDPADVCCRDHDSCNIWVLAGETMYGYTNNNELITQMNCQCDKQFYWCLRRMKQIHGEATNAISIMQWFFGRLLDIHCFMFEKGPICHKYEKQCSEGNCVEVCADQSYKYQAFQYKVDQGEIRNNLD